MLTSNETIISPKTQRNSDFWNLQLRETKIAFKNGQKSDWSWNQGKIAAFDWREGDDFWFELSGGSKKWGFEESRFHCSYFETSHTPILWLQSTASGVKSETYKRNSSFSRVRELQVNFLKPALCGAIQNGSFQSNHKNKSLGRSPFPLRLSSFCHCFLDGNNIHLVSRSFDLNSVFTRQTSVKVSYKPGLKVAQHSFWYLCFIYPFL